MNEHKMHETAKENLQNKNSGWVYKGSLYFYANLLEHSDWKQEMWFLWNTTTSP